MKKYGGLAASLLCCATALYFILHYVRSRPDSNKVEAYTMLLHQGKQAVAAIQPIGESKTVIVNGNPETYYLVSYSFKAGNKSYGGETYMPLLNSRTIRVWYLPRYPFINAANPKAELEAERNKGSIADLSLGGLLLLCAGGGLFFFIKAAAQEKKAAVQE